MGRASNRGHEGDPAAVHPQVCKYVGDGSLWELFFEVPPEVIENLGEELDQYLDRVGDGLDLPFGFELEFATAEDNPDLLKIDIGFPRSRTKPVASWLPPKFTEKDAAIDFEREAAVRRFVEEVFGQTIAWLPHAFPKDYVSLGFAIDKPNDTEEVIRDLKTGIEALIKIPVEIEHFT